MTKHDTTPDPIQGSRILVVDDIEVNQHLALLILEDAGYQVDIVKNGQEAVETYQQNHFDLILMDIQMPLMDGYEATKRIRNLESGLRPLRAVGSIYEPEAGGAMGACAPEGRRNKIGNNSDSSSEIHLSHPTFKQVPIIAMTGDAAGSVLDTCRQKGMNAVIAKPLQRDQLLAVVQEWTDAGPQSRNNESEKELVGLSAQTSPDSQAPLDLEKAIDEFLGKKDILFSVLEAFISSVRDKIIAIQKACSLKDYEVIAAAAHSIKGGAANLTAFRLAGFASDLEEAAISQMPEQVGRMVDKMEEQFRQLEQYFHHNGILSTIKEKKRKILIVEDEIISQTKLALILEDFGKCELVDNGKEAITLVDVACQNKDPYGLIMLDINLPEISILSSIREIEKNYKIQNGGEAKILMISSYRDKHRIIACHQLGCNDYIAKPFVAEVIRKKIAELGFEEPVAEVEDNDIIVPAVPTAELLVKSISAVFERKKISLPTLPKIKIKFKKLNKTGSFFKRTVNLLKKDVAISTELIRISNSPQYKGLEANKSVEQAITRLGMAVTEQIVDELSGSDVTTMKIKKYRSLMEIVSKHSIACAYASEITSNLLNIQLATDPFSMGLHHDVGKLAMLKIIADMEQKDKFNGKLSSDLLVRTIAEHHCQFGAKLLEKWKYSDSYINIALHHQKLDMAEEAEVPGELLIVHFANAVAKSIGYDLNPDSNQIKDLQKIESAELLKLNSSHIIKVKNEVIDRMKGVSELF